MVLLYRHLGHAVLVVRWRVHQDTTGHRGRVGDPLYGIRELLLKASQDLDGRGWTRLAAGLRAGDPEGENDSLIWPR